ncbi:MAG: (p)ppGpp synthetase, partial [Patescibacteria group bacterium]
MAFPPVPEYSKNEINRAGQILIDSDSTKEERRAARQIVSEWRACYGYPINTFNSTLRDKVRKGYDSPIVAQRLKRLPTIIDKLKRYPDMNLVRMQDIGGLRAVVKSVKDVRKLEKVYRDSARLN